LELEKVEQQSPMALISKAIESNISVETMEKLMNLQERWDKKKAKEAFDEAMAKFQEECPVIVKDTKVYEKGQQNIQEAQRKVRYRYAKLDSIVRQTKGIIAKNSFSYLIKTVIDKEFLIAICRVTHSAGHSEETDFKVPIGGEEFMSDVQKYGARMTFAKRYVFCNAFGILTGDEDVDGQADDKKDDGKATIIFEAVKKANMKDLKEIELKLAKSTKYKEQRAEIKKAIADRRQLLTKPPKGIVYPDDEESA